MGLIDGLNLYGTLLFVVYGVVLTYIQKNTKNAFFCISVEFVLSIFFFISIFASVLGGCLGSRVVVECSG